MSNRYAGVHDAAKNTVQAFMQKFGTMFKYGVSSTGNTSTAWKVTQRGAGANMSVDIAAGDGLLYDASFPYSPWSDAVINKTVTTAPSGGNSRKDIVVAYINESAITTASNDGLDAFDFMVVAGTAAASPSDPSDSAIQIAVGSGNPWIKLARITVPASVSTIIDAYITDIREPVAFKGNLFGGSSNTLGHRVPNATDGYVAITTASTGKNNAASTDFGGSGSGIWWEEIARTTLTGAGDTISVTSIPARKYLKVMVSLQGTGGTVEIFMRFNNDSAANYSRRFLDLGGSATTATSETSAVISGAATYANSTFDVDIINILAQEKLMHGLRFEPSTAGAGTAPTGVVTLYKWANTAAQISRIDVINSAGTGDYAIGSEVIVLGHN